MRKLLFAAVIAVFTMTSMNAQGFSIGSNVGFPMGDSGDFYSISYGLDVTYMFEVSDGFNAGVATGYTTTGTKDVSIGGFDIEIESFSYLPIAAAARYSASDKFTVGADLGFALGMGDGGDGGFYYRPMAGYNISDNFAINAYYTGISVEGGSFSTVGAGVMYSF